MSDRTAAGDHESLRTRTGILAPGQRSRLTPCQDRNAQFHNDSGVLSLAYRFLCTVSCGGGSRAPGEATAPSLCASSPLRAPSLPLLLAPRPAPPSAQPSAADTPIGVMCCAPPGMRLPSQRRICPTFVEPHICFVRNLVLFNLSLNPEVSDPPRLRKPWGEHAGGAGGDRRHVGGRHPQPGLQAGQRHPQHAVV